MFTYSECLIKYEYINNLRILDNIFYDTCPNYLAVPGIYFFYIPIFRLMFLMHHTEWKWGVKKLFVHQKLYVPEK